MPLKDVVVDEIANTGDIMPNTKSSVKTPNSRICLQLWIKFPFISPIFWMIDRYLEAS